MGNDLHFGENGGGGGTADDLLDALSHVRRRLLIALLDHNPQCDTPVAVADSESEADDLVRLVEMQHVHLPKLVEYGLVEWDRDTRGLEGTEVRRDQADAGTARRARR